MYLFKVSKFAFNTGWFICDGRNGTPDLSGRFVVGRDVQDKNSEYHKTGAKGGAKSVQLTESQIPRHSHGVDLRTNTIGQHSHPYVDVLFPVEGATHLNLPDFGLGGWKRDVSYDGKDSRYVTRGATTSESGAHVHTVSGRTEPTGANSAFDNRPPYYTVVYIVYKGTDVSPLVG